MNYRRWAGTMIGLIAALPFAAVAETESLPTITVEGNLQRPGTVGLVPGSIGLKDTASLLQTIPGADVNRNGPLTGIAQYRGMAGNRINVSVDGYAWKEVGPNSMDPSLSHLPAALTETLQVYRGISPVSSGMETIGGSMKVKSRKGHFAVGDDLLFEGLASGGYSSVDNGRFGSLFSSLANENHRLYISGSKERGYNYDYHDNDAVLPSRYDREAATLGYGYQRNGHQFDVTYSHNDTGPTGTPSLPMDIIYVRGGVASAEYEGTFGDIQMDANFHYQDMRHKMNNTTLRQTPMAMTPLGMVTVSREAYTEVDGFAAHMGFTLPLARGDLSIGFDVDQSLHDAFVLDPNNAMFYVDAFSGVERDRYSIFTEWRGDIVDNLSLELGARYTWVNSSSDTVTGRNPLFMQLAANGFNGPLMSAMALNQSFNTGDRDITHHNVDLVAILRHAISDQLDVEFGLARKTRAPSYQELFIWIPLETTGGLADGRNYIGNVDLQEETSYQIELGMEWHSADLYVAPRAFYHYVDDYIQGVPTDNAAANLISNLPPFGGKDALQFGNIDAQLYGVDVEAGYTINDNLRVDGSLSYVRGERLDEEDDLYRIPPFNARLQTTYQQSFWQVSAEGVFYDSQEDVSSFNNEQETSGYALLNLRSQLEPLAGLTIGLGVENVFDTEHASHLAGINRVIGNKDLAVGARVPDHGRNFYATMSYQW